MQRFREKFLNWIPFYKKKIEKNKKILRKTWLLRRDRRYMAKNSNLHAAKKAKNDEFYTQLTDIEKELKHYKKHFKDKCVFCNCDDPEYSNFWKYFSLNFDALGLKRLLATHYSETEKTYKLDMYRDEAGVHTEIQSLKGTGDFRSEECIELLKQSDIVVTNPPFSCYSSDTQVKTNHGWKLFKDVDLENDLILSLNPDTNVIEYVKAVDRFQHRIDGNLLHFQNRHMDLLVTGNHRMLAYYNDCHGNMRPVSDRIGRLPYAEEIKPSWTVPIDGFHYSSDKQIEIKLPAVTQKEQYSRKEITVPEKIIDLKAWLEFFGFYLADGCFRDHINVLGKRDYTIIINQNKKNEDYVLNLINRIGFTPFINHCTDKNYNYCIYSKQLWTYLQPFGRSEDKYIPDEYLNLDPEYLECLLRGYKNGDSHGDEKLFMFSSRSKRLMEGIQEILLKLYGHLWQVRTVPAIYKNEPYKYYIIRLSLQSEPYKFSKYGHPESVEYHDDVFCLQLERNGVMLVRRAEAAAWCGNCFREYVAQLMEYEKKFIIIGSKNAVTYKEFFPLLKNDKVWLGWNASHGSMSFATTVGGPPQSSVASYWYTNLDHPKRHEPITLFRKFSDDPDKYPIYDNYAAFNVDKTTDIPEEIDFEMTVGKIRLKELQDKGFDIEITETSSDEQEYKIKIKNPVMGVPISFMDKYCPRQFEIVGATESEGKGFSMGLWDEKSKIAQPMIHGKRCYKRIFIRRQDV